MEEPVSDRGGKARVEQSRSKSASKKSKRASKRKSKSLADIILGTLAMKVPHRQGYRTTSTSLAELGIKALVNRAVEGNLDAAELILRKRAYAERHGDAGVEELRIVDGLPGYRGQTAEKRTAEFAENKEAAPAEWWDPPPGPPGPPDASET
jgi:hypothetical protein